VPPDPALAQNATGHSAGPVSNEKAHPRRERIDDRASARVMAATTSPQVRSRRSSVCSAVHHRLLVRIHLPSYPYARSRSQLPRRVCPDDLAVAAGSLIGCTQRPACCPDQTAPRLLTRPGDRRTSR